MSKLCERESERLLKKMCLVVKLTAGKTAQFLHDWCPSVLGGLTLHNFSDVINRISCSRGTSYSTSCKISRSETCLYHLQKRARHKMWSWIHKNIHKSLECIIINLTNLFHETPVLGLGLGLLSNSSLRPRTRSWVYFWK